MLVFPCYPHGRRLSCPPPKGGFFGAPEITTFWRSPPGGPLRGGAPLGGSPLERPSREGDLGMCTPSVWRGSIPVGSPPFREKSEAFPTPRTSPGEKRALPPFRGANTLRKTFWG